MILKKISKKIKVLFASIFIICSTLSFVAFTDNDFEITKNLDIYYTLFKEVNIFYVDDIDPAKLIKTSIDAMLKSLDPYTNYIPESQIEDYKFMTTGQYGGIGAMIRKQDDYVVISEPYKNFPAQKAGLKAGEIIISVDGDNIKGKTTSQVSDKLKGQPNTKLNLKIKRPGVEKNINVSVMREEIKLSSVPYYGLVSDSVGYIRLSRFTRDAGKDVKHALNSLKNKNIKSVILDLRGNPGGLLIEAVKITNIFIPKGEDVVSTKGKVSQWDKEYKAMFQTVDTKIPLVILVNRSSASASEIVSGALQDLDRGVVIGERSFGKGLVQTTRKLSYNAQLKVTTAKYYIPSGRCIQALDYTNRREDGSVGKIPDSLITKFKTKNGRVVYDGGGILPDIIRKSESYSPIAFSLVVKNLIFDYATKYALKHDSVPTPDKFVFNDNDFKDFIEFLSDKDFDYETNSIKNLEDLIKSVKKEKYYKGNEALFDTLEIKLAHDKNKDLQNFKTEIKELLTEEIMSRYYYQDGRIQSMLLKDPIIDDAVKLLKDTTKYNSILAGTCKDAQHKLEE